MSRIGLWINFFVISLILFVSGIFFLRIAHAGTLSCSVATTCPSGTVIFRMQNTTNAHAEVATSTAYTQLVCCSGVTGLSSACAAPFATVLKLSGTTNAHVQQTGTYANSACMSVPSGGTVSVGYQATNCAGFDTTLGSMSAVTNAHVGNSAAYPSIQICGTAAGAGGNSAPTVSSVSLNKAVNVTLIENTTTSVIVTGTLTDVDGGADISSATATVYRSGVASACAADDNNCYRLASASCALGAASGNTKPATCTAAVWFIADPTDAGAPSFSAQIWSAELTAIDAASAKGSATNSAESIEVNSLTALSVTGSISYGSLAPTSTSPSSQIAIVTTTGNRAINVQFQAVNDMCDTTNCVGGNEITADRQQFATSSIAWSDPVILGAVKLASTSAQTLNIATTKPTTHVDNTSDTATSTYWRIGIPAGQAVATYNGTTTATAVNNP